MEKVSNGAGTVGPANIRAGKLSYKFQRLRERIRQAIVSGELTGKLPGERELAKRFKANPKTMGKALTDLAAEGLLERSIGRGTYTRGSDKEGKPTTGRWLILCDRADADCPVAAQLMGAHAEAEVSAVTGAIRPSFLNQFSLVIDMAESTPEALHRDLMVRGIPVLLVEKESGAYRMNSILLDRVHAVAVLTREMVLAGHRRILVVEDEPSGKASRVAQTTALRYSEDVQVQSCSIDDVCCMSEAGAAAIVCERLMKARKLLDLVEQYPHLKGLSIAATGVCSDEPPFSGVYITPTEMAAAAMKMMEDVANHRPTTMWLSGKYIDRGTIRALSDKQFSDGQRMGALSA